MSAHFFETTARSAIGLVRQGNEDSGFSSAQLIAVADGMGGHAAGEVASRIAVQVLQKLAPTLAATDIDEDSVEDLLMHSLHSIDTPAKSSRHHATFQAPCGKRKRKGEEKVKDEVIDPEENYCTTPTTTTTANPTLPSKPQPQQTTILTWRLAPPRRMRL